MSKMSMKYIRTSGKPLITNKEFAVYYRYNRYYYFDLVNKDIQEILPIKSINLANNTQYEYSTEDIGCDIVGIHDNKLCWYFRYKEEK